MPPIVVSGSIRKDATTVEPVTSNPLLTSTSQTTGPTVLTGS